MEAMVILAVMVQMVQMVQQEQTVLRELLLQPVHMEFLFSSQVLKVTLVDLALVDLVVAAAAAVDLKSVSRVKMALETAAAAVVAADKEETVALVDLVVVDHLVFIW